MRKYNKLVQGIGAFGQALGTAPQKVISGGFKTVPGKVLREGISGALGSTSTATAARKLLAQWVARAQKEIKP